MAAASQAGIALLGGRDWGSQPQLDHTESSRAMSSWLAIVSFISLIGHASTYQQLAGSMDAKASRSLQQTFHTSLQPAVKSCPHT